MDKTIRTKQILHNQISKNSVNTNTHLKVNLDSEQRVLPPDEMNHVVNAYDRFDEERQKSPYYRIIGTINPIISNPLFNLDDNPLDLNTMAGFNDYRFLDKSYPRDNTLIDKTDLNFSQAIKTSLKEKDGWFGYFDPDITKAALCKYNDMEPTRDRFSFIPDKNPYHAQGSDPVKNWELTITYPAKADKTHFIVNNGLLVLDALPAVVSQRNMVSIGLPCLHNLKTNDTVFITGSTGQVYDGTFVVVRTGLDNGDLKGYYFVIDTTFVTNAINSNTRMKRVFGGVPSEYYFRQFKKINTRNGNVIETDDYETYNTAFSENVFTDSISQFVFNEDINVDGLKDNLGRPLSEIYLTIIKTTSSLSGSTNANTLFTNVSSGIESPFIERITQVGTYPYLVNFPIINRIHNGITIPFQTCIPLENHVSINDNNNIVGNDYYYGDLVEYNILEQREIVLADIQHRFNTVNRETIANLSYVSETGSSPILINVNLGPRQEGYFYKAHYLIKTREFSSYIEQGDRFTGNIPSYAVDLGDSRFIWRDLLTIGFNESSAKPLDYPFLNGCHYMYDNYCFHVRRQDPFAVWDLYHAAFPPDPFGDSITDKFNTNSADNVC